MKNTFRGSVDGAGAICWRSQAERDDVRHYLRSLRGKDIEVVIRKPQRKRTVDQNAFWWAVPVRLLAEHCGYSDTQMHYALLGECFGYTPGPLGQPVPVKPSSSELTVEDFTRLIEWVLVWGPTEMGVDIPPPPDVDLAS